MDIFGRIMCPSGMRAVAHGQAARPEGPDSVSGQDVRTCWTPNPSEDVVSGL